MWRIVWMSFCAELYCPPTTESSALYLDHRPLYLEHWPLHFVQSSLRFVQSSSYFVQSCIAHCTSTTGVSATGSGQSTSRAAQGAKFVAWQTKNGTAMGTVLRIVVLFSFVLCFLAALRRFFGGLFFGFRLKHCRFCFEFSEFCA